MQKVLKLSGKRTDTEQNSGELYTKKHQQGNSYFLEIILQSLLKKIIFQLYRKNPSGKKTE